MFVCSLLFYVLVTSKVISGWALICDSVHSWRLYSDPIGKPCRQYNDLISHLIILSEHWANHSLPYFFWSPTPAQEATSVTFISHWFNQTMGSNPQSPVHVTSALPIRPPVVHCIFRYLDLPYIFSIYIKYTIHIVYTPYVYYIDSAI